MNIGLVEDIKNEFVNLMYDFKGDHVKTTNQIIKNYSYELNDDDDSIAVIIGLALAQWESGVLDQNIKNNAEKLAVCKNYSYGNSIF